MVSMKTTTEQNESKPAVNGFVKGYKAIEHGVVTSYKAIENGVVTGYKAVEDKFVKTFLPSFNDTVSEMRGKSGEEK
jgi:hypothetical protein